LGDAQKPHISKDNRSYSIIKECMFPIITVGVTSRIKLKSN